jgi:hypothetical protein
MSQSGNAVIFDRIKDKIGIVVVSAAQYKEKLSHAYTWDNTGENSKCRVRLYSNSSFTITKWAQYPLAAFHRIPPYS